MNFAKECEKFGIFLNEDMLKKFESYYELLAEWNNKFNLTTIILKEEVYLKHFLDSVSVAENIPQGAKICDVGSGAGFPGIVLSIIRPDLKVYLIDSVNKKITFLKAVCGELNLNAECLHFRAEDLAKTEMRESFDIVTARAVANLSTLCEYTLPLIKCGGAFIAMKASCEDEIKNSKNAISLLGGKLKDIDRFLLANEFERTIIIIEKIGKTPQKYPRGKNLEREKPL